MERITERIIDEEIKLIPYYRNDEVSLPWYQNQHIGRRCVEDMLKLAKEKGMDTVKANIYSFNGQSRRMFETVGFKQIDEEWYEYQSR